jgi:muramoyltetrapeptide carboxypeptidase
MRFAGDDVTRIAAIHRAAASGADVALISRGGYGLTRILPGIAYKKVAKAIEGRHPVCRAERLHRLSAGLAGEDGRHQLGGAGAGRGFRRRG